MSLTDLVQLEQLLYAKLGHIRNTKTRRMIEIMSVLQEKEKKLMEEKLLKGKELEDLMKEKQDGSSLNSNLGQTRHALLKLL